MANITGCFHWIWSKNWGKSLGKNSRTQNASLKVNPCSKLPVPADSQFHYLLYLPLFCEFYSRLLNNIFRSVSWERARSNCRAYYSSGNLAVITSPEVNDFLTKFANTTVWIGLEGRGVYRGELPFPLIKL